MEKYIKGSPVPDLVGSSHRYKTEKGEISLLYPSFATMELYEIFCIEGELFEDIERFDTLEEAEQRIRELLNSDTNDKPSVATEVPSSNADGKQK